MPAAHAALPAVGQRVSPGLLLLRVEHHNEQLRDLLQQPVKHEVERRVELGRVLRDEQQLGTLPLLHNELVQLRGGGGGGGGGGGYDDDSGYYGVGGNGGYWGGGGGGSSYYASSLSNGQQGIIAVAWNTVFNYYVNRGYSWYGYQSINYTIPSGLSYVTVNAWGGGGGGGSSYGNPAKGGDGGNTTLTLPGYTTLTAGGGYGGYDSVSRYYAAPGGGGGSASGGTTNASGGGGGSGYTTNSGGSSPYGGGGGTSAAINGPGGAGGTPGGGGGGGFTYDGSRSGYYQVGGGGGGGGFSQYYNANANLGGITATGSVGAGGTGGRYGQWGGNGGTGLVTISGVKQVPIVPPGASTNPVTPVSMTDLANTFLLKDEPLPTGPYSLASFYAKNLTAYNYVSVGGPVDTSAKTISAGIGIQSGTYTQKIPSGGTISLGSFANTYQLLYNRLPVIIDNVGDVYDPPAKTYAKHDIVRYYYTGRPQVFNFYNARVIRIECWGGNGGGDAYFSFGGYSIGVYVGSMNQSLYVYVGGAGRSDGGAYAYQRGGWNGGGVGYYWDDGEGGGGAGSGGGGGATDVRTNYIASVPDTIDNPGYWSAAATTTSLNSRLIVAGGGGGNAWDYTYGGYWYGGGYGGGTTGGAGTYGGGYSGAGGTQSSYGSSYNNYAGWYAGFGFGANAYPAYTDPVLGGGGGGWYGGGCGYPGGGGSGYVGGMLPNTVTGSQNFGWGTYNVQYGQTGFVNNGGLPNGLCLISILG